MVIAALLAAGCKGRGIGVPLEETDPTPEPTEVAPATDAEPPDGGPPEASEPTPSLPETAEPETPEAEPELPAAPLAAVRLGAWNLKNFSVYGPSENRTANLATKLLELQADAIGIEEIKVADGSQGQGPQAWDALLELLPGHQGVHVTYNPDDTAVGLVWRTETTTLDAWRPLFETKTWPFPRAPLEADLHVQKGDAEADLTLIVVHLKAFDEGLERRREACQKLAAYMAADPDRRFIVMGDFNDDPYDPAELNSFLGTLQATEPDFYFVTAVLPKDTVTSIGWYHVVDGQPISGEFLDHVVMNGSAWGTWSAATPGVLGLPWNEHAAFEEGYSDHFPVTVELTP
jgi:endonuclease/exonuclease/phosphatase family metal-dependent hydrolase